MKTKTVYVVIKAKVEVSNDFEECDESSVEDIIGSEADYELSYDDDGLKIVDTELLACLDECPV